MSYFVVDGICIGAVKDLEDFDNEIVWDLTIEVMVIEIFIKNDTKGMHNLD